MAAAAEHSVPVTLPVVSIQERLVSLRRAPVVGRFARIALKILGLEVPAGVSVSRGLRLPHGAVGLVVHESTRIGTNVTLYQGVTVGRSDTWMDARYIRPPGGGVTIGDGAVVGAGAAILFRSGQHITIGSESVIGANSVVLCDIPDGEIWAGNPATYRSARSDFDGQLRRSPE